MTNEEFVDSLTPDQTAAMNTLLISHRNSLQAMYAQAEVDLVASQTAMLRTLNENNAIIVNEMTNAKDKLTTERTELASEKAVLTERLSRLLVDLPFDPRLITIDAFLRRVEKETFQLAKTGKADPNIQGFLDILIQKANDSESVNLDSPRLSGALQYLLDKELLTENRVKEIIQDGTREESIED